MDTKNFTYIASRHIYSIHGTVNFQNSMMMEKKNLLAVFLAVCISVGNAKTPQKIIGGRMASIMEFPYQVSLQTKKGLAFCGGTIIDEAHILTAAHCIVKPNLEYYDDEFKVITGTADKEHRTLDNTFNVVEQIYHPHYDYNNNVKNDIAILKLDRLIPFNKYQQAARLPTTDAPAGTKLVATGWGATDFFRPTWRGGRVARYLQKLETFVISNQQCQMASFIPNSVADGLPIKVREVLRKRKVQAEQICTYTRSGDVCSGDSGGPLSSNGTVFGIASLVVGCNQGFPATFTRVFSYLPWIRKTTKTTTSTIWMTR